MKRYRIGPETKRLQHRAFTPEDAETFFSINGNQEVMRLTGEPTLPSVDAARDAIEAYPDFDEIGYGRWACVLKDTKTIIGFCGLKYLSDLKVVDVGYRFLPEYWGQGFATEACSASLEFGFQTLGLKEIHGFVLPDNIGSIRVLNKTGMQSEGEFSYDGMSVLRFVKRIQNPTNSA